MNISKHNILTLITGLGIVLISATSYAEMISKLFIDNRQLTVRPQGWCAPFSMLSVSSDGEKIKSFTLKLKGISSSDIKEAAIFTWKGNYSESLIYSPEDGKKWGTKLKKISNGIIQAELIEDVVLPVDITTARNILIAFKLNGKIKSKSFQIALQKVTLTKSNYRPSEKLVKCIIDKSPAKFTVSTKRRKYLSGAKAVIIKVSSNEELAYPPQITFDYHSKNSIKDFHTYPVRKYSSPMKKLSDKVYEYTYLSLVPLTNNFSKNKQVSYSYHPAPNSWRWRKDNTGYDLIDGDARSGVIAMPGGMRWIFSNTVEINFDLKKMSKVGKVIIYCSGASGEIKVSGKKKTDRQWTLFAKAPAQQRPAIQYGPKKSMYRAVATFDKLHKARFVKIKIPCNNDLVVTEVIILGNIQGEKVLKPNSMTIYVCDKAGNISNKKIKLGKKVFF